MFVLDIITASKCTFLLDHDSTTPMVVASVTTPLYFPAIAQLFPSALHRMVLSANAIYMVAHSVI